MNDQTSHTEMNPTVSKVAMTDRQGNALSDMRFSVSEIRFEKTTTVSIVLECKVEPGRWVMDSDLTLHAQGIKPDEVAHVVVDFITMLHRQVMGFAPMGRIFQMEAPK
jgi:hypothetical protein